MKELKPNRRIKLSIFLSISLLLLTFTEYYWEQISEFAPPVGITALLFLTILIFGKLLSTGLTLIRLRKNLTFKISLPTIIYASTLILIFLNPHFLNAENYQPKIKYRGCYEGTINTGTILFREQGKFEYRHVGFFGITTFKNGSWSQQGDTLTIEYINDPSEFVGTKLLLTPERFIKIKGDSLLIGTLGFYRGYCKGLN